MARKIGKNNIHDIVSLNGIKLVDGIPEGCHVAQAMSSPDILNIGKTQVLDALRSGTLSQETKNYYKKIHESMIFYEKHPGEEGLKAKGLDVERVISERASMLEDIEVTNMVFENNKEIENAFNQSIGKILEIPKEHQDELKGFDRESYLQKQKENMSKILEETQDDINKEMKLSLKR